MGAFAAALAQQGAQQIGNLASAGMGLLLGGINDRRQLKQQEKLQKLQMAGQREMSTFNKEQQLDLWRKTNFKAQMEQLKMAGLNPGLIYGMSGAGGATASAQPGNVGGGQAPIGGREVQDMIGMGMQLQLLKAQKENIEADTKLKEAGTGETKSKTELNLQGLDNLREDYEVKRLTQSLMNLEIYKKEQTIDEEIEYVEYNTKTAAKLLEKLVRENKMSEELYNENIEIVQQNAIGAMLNNAAIRAGITKTKEETLKISREILNIADMSNLKWTELEKTVGHKTAELLKGSDGFNENTVRELGRAIVDILSLGGAFKKGHIPVRGFQR